MVFLGSCFGQAGAHASGSSRAHQRQTGTHWFACRKRSTEPERRGVATPATTRAARAICSLAPLSVHVTDRPTRNAGARPVPFHLSRRRSPHGSAATAPAEPPGASASRRLLIYDLSSARREPRQRPVARPPDAHRQIFCWRAWTRIAAVLCSSCPSTVGKILRAVRSPVSSGREFSSVGCNCRTRRAIAVLGHKKKFNPKMSGRATLQFNGLSGSTLQSPFTDGACINAPNTHLHPSFVTSLTWFK